MTSRKQFIQAEGLHNLFDKLNSNSLDFSSLKSDIQCADSNSIIFITANGDMKYGYADGLEFIWTHGELFNMNDTQFATVGYISDDTECISEMILDRGMLDYMVLG